MQFKILTMWGSVIVGKLITGLLHACLKIWPKFLRLQEDSLLSVMSTSGWFCLLSVSLHLCQQLIELSERTTKGLAHKAKHYSSKHVSDEAMSQITRHFCGTVFPEATGCRHAHKIKTWGMLKLLSYATFTQSDLQQQSVWSLFIVRELAVPEDERQQALATRCEDVWEKFIQILSELVKRLPMGVNLPLRRFYFSSKKTSFHPLINIINMAGGRTLTWG